MANFAEKAMSLPLYKIRKMEYWPLAGWIPASLSALSVFFLGGSLPPLVVAAIAVLIPLAVGRLQYERLFIAGSEQLLGSYGRYLITLTVPLQVLVVASMPTQVAVLALFAGIPFSRMIAGQLVLMLRPDTASRYFTLYPSFQFAGAGGKTNGRVYLTGALYFAFGILPLVFMLWQTDWQLRWDIIIFGPCLVMYFLYLALFRRHQGYNDAVIALASQLILLTFLAAVAFLR